MKTKTQNNDLSGLTPLMQKGTMDALGEDFYNSKVKNPISERAGRLILGRRNAKSTDWIPGDRGYIENDYLWKQIRNGRKMESLTPSETLQLGENIIYLGAGEGWAGYDGKVETKTSVDAWVQKVTTFKTNKDRSATLSGNRLYPKIGVK